MLISLSDVLTKTGKVECFEVPLEAKECNYQGSSYKYVKKEPVILTLTNLGKKTILIEGNTKVSLLLYCSRCLKEIVYPVDIHVSRKIDFNLSEEERAKNLDETNYIIGYNLDVDILIYDEVLLDFPMKLLCSNDCKGICDNCGADLNEKDCDCDKKEYDPRMLVIRDIFDNFKEV